MKRAVCLFFLCLCLGVGGAVWTIHAVYSTRDQVVITRQTRSGDPAAAQGLQLHEALHYQRHLVWETDFSATDPEGAVTQVTYRTGKHAVPLPRPEANNFSLFSYSLELMYTRDSGKWVPEPAYADLLAALQPILDRTEPGQTHREDIPAADVADFYPVSPDITVLKSWNRDMSYDSLLVSPLDLSMFTDFFHMAIPEGAAWTVEVSKDSTGRVLSVMVFQSDHWARNLPPVASVFTQDRIYFTLRTADGLRPDLSDSPSGLGIYCLDLTRNADAAQVSNLRTVYPIDPAASILSFQEDGDQLLLTYQLGDTFYCDILRKEDASLIQQVSVPAGYPVEVHTTIYGSASGGDPQDLSWDYLDPDLKGIARQEDLLLFLGHHDLHLFQKTGGQYEEVFSGIAPDYDFQPGTVRMAWDGQKLALAGLSHENILAVAVYDGAEKPAYQGHYLLSQAGPYATDFSDPSALLSFSGSEMEREDEFVWMGYDNQTSLLPVAGTGLQIRWQP